MNLSSFGVAFATLFVAACLGRQPGPPHLEGPGPDDSITTRVAGVGEIARSTGVVCIGSASELSSLGDLCDGTTLRAEVSWSVASRGIVVSGPSNGVRLLIFAYYEGITWIDDPGTIRYAAFLLTDGLTAEGDEPGWQAYADLARWSEGQALTGEVATSPTDVSCTSNPFLHGTFAFGGVTLEVDVVLDFAC